MSPALADRASSAGRLKSIDLKNCDLVVVRGRKLTRHNPAGLQRVADYYAAHCIGMALRLLFSDRAVPGTIEARCSSLPRSSTAIWPRV